MIAFHRVAFEFDVSRKTFTKCMPAIVTKYSEITHEIISK